MTAINPARLKIQCAELSQKASNPDQFTSGLHDLLTFYAARVRQTDLANTPLTLQSYQVPPPVLRSLVKELEGPLEDDPEQGLFLVDRLWKEDWVEFRQLAIKVLGSLPPDFADSIIERIHAWLGSCTSEHIRQEIMFTGLHRLSTELPAAAIRIINELIATGKKADHQAAIFGLRSLVKTPEFEDIPTIFNHLGKILLTEETGLLKEINALIKDLRAEAEEETTYFLLQQLPQAAKPRITRVTRTVAGGFSQENRRLLREAVKKYSR